MSILHSIEEGEANFKSSFDEYDAMFPVCRNTAGRKLNNKKEIFWCKAYNKGSCSEESPHKAMVQVSKKPCSTSVPTAGSRERKKNMQTLILSVLKKSYEVLWICKLKHMDANLNSQRHSKTEIMMLMKFLFRIVVAQM